jgi:hypothetical protein
MSRRHAFRSLIAFVTVGLLVFGIAACGGGDDDDEFTEDAQLSDNAVAFTAGPYSGRIEPEWFSTYLVLQDATTSRPAGSKGLAIRRIVENFFNQPSVTHVFYVFFEDKEDFSASMNILRCEPPAATEITGSTENLLKFYEENNIEAETVGTATYNSTNYDIVKVDLNEGYDTHIVALKTGDCITPATLVSKKDDRQMVENFRAVLSELVIDPAQMPKLD